MVRSAIPQPIRDPNTGKTLVAIPAPPFVLTSTPSKKSNITPRREYIYVERKTIPVRNLNAGENDGKRKRPSINRWMVGLEFHLSVSFT